MKKDKIIIDILSRWAIEHLNEKSIDENTCIVSISGSDEEIPNIDHYNCDKLYLQFDDITTKEEHEKFGYALFDEYLAWSILTFIDQQLDKKKFPFKIIIHCHAGICRSAAVGAALSKIMFNQDDHIFREKVPNMLVYRTILQIWFENDDIHKILPNINRIRYQNLNYI